MALFFNKERCITHGRAADTHEIDTHYRMKGLRLRDGTESTKAIRLILAPFDKLMSWTLSERPARILGFEKNSIYSGTSSNSDIGVTTSERSMRLANPASTLPGPHS